MATPITWKNINQPNLASSINTGQKAVDAITSNLEGAGDAVTDFGNVLKRDNTGEGLRQLGLLTDRDKYAQQSQDIIQGLDSNVDMAQIINARDAGQAKLDNTLNQKLANQLTQQDIDENAYEASIAPKIEADRAAKAASDLALTQSNMDKNAQQMAASKDASLLNSLNLEKALNAKAVVNQMRTVNQAFNELPLDMRTPDVYRQLADRYAPNATSTDVNTNFTSFMQPTRDAEQYQAQQAGKAAEAQRKKYKDITQKQQKDREYSANLYSEGQKAIENVTEDPRDDDILELKAAHTKAYDGAQEYLIHLPKGKSRKMTPQELNTVLSAALAKDTFFNDPDEEDFKKAFDDLKQEFGRRKINK